MKLKSDIIAVVYNIYYNDICSICGSCAPLRQMTGITTLTMDGTPYYSGFNLSAIFKKILEPTDIIPYQFDINYISNI